MECQLNQALCWACQQSLQRLRNADSGSSDHSKSSDLALVSVLFEMEHQEALKKQPNNAGVLVNIFVPYDPYEN